MGSPTCGNCGCSGEVSELRTGAFVRWAFGFDVICSDCLRAWRYTFITDPDELKRYVLDRRARLGSAYP